MLLVMVIDAVCTPAVCTFTVIWQVKGNDHEVEGNARYFFLNTVHPLRTKFYRQMRACESDWNEPNPSDITLRFGSFHRCRAVHA